MLLATTVIIVCVSLSSISNQSYLFQRIPPLDILTVRLEPQSSRQQNPDGSNSKSPAPTSPRPEVTSCPVPAASNSRHWWCRHNRKRIQMACHLINKARSYIGGCVTETILVPGAGSWCGASYALKLYFNHLFAQQVERISRR